MSDPIHCPDCGAELPAGLPLGLCSRCALKGALELSEATEPTSPGPAVALILPRPFGDYELLDEIARGGMGVVFKARQRSLGRIVAVKMLLLGQHASADLVRRFKVEAVAAGSLQHPNIVAIHEVGIHDGQHFIVMDYVDGPNLAEFARKQPLPPRRSVQFLRTIAVAIHYAHERRVLHRDLKPSNVIIDSDDQPHVTDFGLATGLGVSPFGADNGDEQATVALYQAITGDGHVLGSPGYMPPEQATGKRDAVGRCSDVYSLGAMLYHLLTGRPPFGGGSLSDTLHQVQNQEPVSPRLLNAGVPRDLETICLKCLEKEPARRYETAQHLAQDLDRFLGDEPIQARPVTRSEKLWRWFRRKPTLAVTGAVAVLVALWATYSAWVIQSTKWDARQREKREWALLFDKHSPMNKLHWSSEDLAGFFGERPQVEGGGERLWIGMYLEEDQQHMVSRFAPLLRYLERALSKPGKPVKFDLQVFNRRAGLEQALASNDPKEHVHLGRIGEAGLSQLLSDTNAGLVPLVQQASGGKVSVIFTRIDTGITNLAGLKNKRLALGGRGSSASGYKLLIRLRRHGLTSRDVDTTYHDDSEQNVDRVLTRDFDAGVTRKDKFVTYTNPELVILDQFDTTRMPWLATKRIAPEMARRIQAAMTALEDQEILQRLPENSANGFAPVDAEYFRRVREDMERVRERFFQDADPKPAPNQSSP